jgi:hypothetical protein
LSSNWRPVQIREGGKVRTVMMFDAMIRAMIAEAGRGNLKVFDRILSMITAPKSLAELAGGRPLFTFTEEERARFSSKKLLEGVVLPDEHDDSPSKENDDSPKGHENEGQPL